MAKHSFKRQNTICISGFHNFLFQPAGEMQCSICVTSCSPLCLIEQYSNEYYKGVRMNAKKKKLLSFTSLCLVLVLLLGVLPAYGQAAEGTAPSQIEQQAQSITPQDVAADASAQPTEEEPAEEEPAKAAASYRLNIRYLPADSTQTYELAPSFTEYFFEGETYSYSSPELEGYEASSSVTEGQMPAHDVDVVVTYEKTEPPALLQEPQAQPEPMSQESHKLVINYFYLDDGSAIGGSVAAAPYYGDYLPNELFSVPSPSVAGYTANTPVVSGQMGSLDQVINVWYEKANQTNYTVQHLFEDAIGNFLPNASYPDQVKQGTTGSETEADAYYVPGFRADSITQVPIAADGNTVVVVKYLRVTNYIYFEMGGKLYIDPVELKYEQIANMPARPWADGYTFLGWYTDADFQTPYTENTVTMGASDITLYAKWEGDEASFRVARYIEDANNPGTYLYADLLEPMWATGTVGELTALSEGDFIDMPEEYTFSHAENVRILADGSATARVYYDRNTYTLNFYRGFVYDPWDPGAWVRSIETTPFKTITAKYGADIFETWNGMGSEFFSYNWLVNNLDPWQNWTSGFKTMPGADHSYYGRPMDGQHKYYLHYYFELLDQSSSDYDLLANGIKYKDSPLHTQIFNYVDQTVTIRSKSNSIFDGFYLPDTNYIQQFDQNASVKEHHGGYLFRRSTLNIDFNTMGGSAAPTRISKPFEEDISHLKPTDPTRAGHSFLGWYDNEVYDGQPFEFDTMPGANTILYAKWQKTDYTVTFDLNYADAPAPPTPQPVGYGDQAVEPAPPTRPGYAFLGWYTNNTGSGSRYVFDKPITAHTTLFAAWTNESVGYTVDYTKEDTGQPFAPQKSAVGRAGRTVTETAAIDNTQKYVPDAASKSLYLGKDAQANTLQFMYKPFTTLSYKVEYRFASDNSLVPQNLLGTANPKVVQNSENARIVEQYLPLLGYVPDSYQKAKMLSYEVTPADITQNVITFYYSPNNGLEYSVEHYLENPSAVSAADKYHAFPALSQVMSAPAGTTVLAASTNFTGYQYNAAASASTNSGTVVNNRDLTLKLYYDINRYTVTFHSMGGSAVYPLTNVAHGSVIASGKPADPTLGTDLFLGWYKEPACQNPWNFASDVVTQNTTLYAKWEQSLSVLYDVNGASGTQTDDTLYKKGSTVTVKGAGGIERTGFTFAGWQLGDTLLGEGQTFVIQNNTTLVAQWKPVVVPPTEEPTQPPTPTPSPRPQPTPSVSPQPTPSVSPQPSDSPSPTQSPAPQPSASQATVPGITQPDDPTGGDGGEIEGGIGAAPIVNTPGELLQRLQDGEVPLGTMSSGKTWSLVNLILTAIGAISAVAVAIYLLVKRSRKQDEADKQEQNQNAKRTPFVLRIASIVAGVLLVVLFLILENMALPVTWINGWTPLMAAIFLAELVLILFGSLRLFGRKDREQTVQQTK